MTRLDEILKVQISSQVEHMNRHLEESERALQERIFKLEGQRIQLEEVRARVSVFKR